MNQQSTDSGEFERRQFLKTTGAAAGLGAFTGVAKAIPDTDLGSVHFVEVGLETDVTDVSDADASLPVFHWDFPLPHAVDAAGETIYLRERMDDEAVHLVTEQDTVVKAAEFHSGPASLLSGVRETVPFELGPHYRRNYVLELEDAIRLPAIEVEPQADSTVAVSGGAVSDTVSPGSEREYELDSVEATVEFSKQTDKRREGQDVPDRLLGFERKEWTETVTLKPTLKVSNFGKLSVVDARDGLVVRQ